MVMAAWRPSGVMDADRPAGEVETRVMAAVAGSARKRCSSVFWAPMKKMPAGVQSSSMGSSSNESVMDLTAPPSAGTIARRPLAWKYSFCPIAESKTMDLPSGDQRGLESGRAG